MGKKSMKVVISLLLAALMATKAQDVCDNGLAPGDVVVTAFNTVFENDESKPVVVLTALKLLSQGTEIFMTDRPLKCTSETTCDFSVPLEETYMDGTVKFTAFDADIPAGSTIAYSKYKKPYSKDNVYFYGTADDAERLYANNWTPVTYSNPEDATTKYKQFHLWSKARAVDVTSEKILTGDNIHLYCLKGSTKVILFSLLYSDDPNKIFLSNGQDLHEGKGAGSKVATLNTMISVAAGPSPNLLLTPGTIPNSITEGEVECSCNAVGSGSPLNGYTCTDSSSGQCQSDETCNSDMFSSDTMDDACGLFEGIANSWEHRRNHWRLRRPSCGLSRDEYLSYVTSPANWMYTSHHDEHPLITSVSVTSPYEPGYCPPDNEDDYFDVTEQLTEQTAREEALKRSADNRLGAFMTSAQNIEQENIYRSKIQAYIARGSRFFPDGVTPIPGNENPSTEAIDPRLPTCFGIPDCPDGKPIGILEEQAAAFEAAMNATEYDEVPPADHEDTEFTAFEPTPAPTRTPTAAPTDPLIAPRYIGCFRDASKRALKKWLPGSFHSQAKCEQMCMDRGYKFSGLQWYGECFCGQQGFDKYGQLADKDCNCAGRNVGGWRNCVSYLVDGPLNGKRAIYESKLTSGGAMDLLVDAGGDAQTSTFN